ncbi:MAG: hypothetical protein HC878_19625 [Leptolyngbyaceae cyanobacterium SL_5_14]|nr:hypothetical protein [Leptolyngbyaceae cyanobacterium SL_5_14]
MKLSNPLLVVIFLFSLIAVLLLSLSNQRYEKILDRSAMAEGPKWEEANTKNEQSTSNYTQFIYALVIPSTGLPDSCCSNVAELDKLAQAHVKKENRSHPGNRMWYWKSTPVDKNEYVLLIWQDLKKNEYDWIAVKNTPAFWYTIRKDGKTNVVLDGHQLVCGRYVNKKYLEIRVKNPPNIKGWTPYDFWYSFSEDEVQPTRKQMKFASWLSNLVDKTCYSESD